MSSSGVGVSYGSQYSNVAAQVYGQAKQQYNDPSENGVEKNDLSMKDLNLREAKNILGRVLQTDVVPFLWGPPGVGKSTLVRDICQDNGWKIIDLRLSLLNPVDLRGLPVVNKEDNVAQWLSPSFLPPMDSVEKGVLFLDEINLAPMSVQAAAYQLILDKRVGEYKLPESWKIIAAGNRETDRANVYKMSAPLANRFIHFNIQPDFKTWKDWAVSNVRQEIVDFLRVKQDLLFKMPNGNEKSFPTPRSWTQLSKVMDNCNYSDEGLDEGVKQIIYSAIGEGAGTAFIAFLSEYKNNEINKIVEEFINTGKLKMPKSISMRQLVTGYIYNNYREGTVTKEQYQNVFLPSLSEEERAGIKDYENHCAREIRERYDGPKPNPNAELSKTNNTLGYGPGLVGVVDEIDFDCKKAIIFNKRGLVEVVEVLSQSGTNLAIGRRGLDGTTEHVWAVGSLIQRYQ